MKKSVSEIDIVGLFKRGVNIDRLIHRVTVECGITSKEARDAVQKKLYHDWTRQLKGSDDCGN